MVTEIWSVMNRIFCHIGHFFPFYPCNSPKNENFQKIDKTPGDMIILHIGTKNHDHMLHSS